MSIDQKTNLTVDSSSNVPNDVENNVSPSSNQSPPISPTSTANNYKVKCSLNGADMHVFSLTEDEQHDYYKLCSKIKSAFNMKTDAQMLKYKIVYTDADGDELTISNNQDLKEAIRMYPSQLKMNLLQKDPVRSSIMLGDNKDGAINLTSGMQGLTIRKESVSANSDRRTSTQTAGDSFVPRQSFKMGGAAGPLIQQTPVAGPDHPLYKTVECKHWAATQTCPRGNQCGFWHRGVDPEELLNRRVSVRQTQSPIQHSPNQRMSTMISSAGAVNNRTSEIGFKPYKACQYFINGKCMKGDACTFSHSPQLCAQAAKEQQLQLQQQSQLGLPLDNKPNSRRQSTNNPITSGNSTLGVNSSTSQDGTLTPTRRFHQQAASMGSTGQFLGMSAEKLNQRLSTISNSVNPRTHYKSEHGSEKVELSKSWRREDNKNNENSSIEEDNEPNIEASDKTTGQADQSSQTSPKETTEPK